MKKIIYAILPILVFLTLSKTVNAAPELGLPIDCQIGQNCWIANYMDVDPQENGAKDFTCSSHTYDNHKGTDIAIRDLVTMEKGVNVLAAADGNIFRLRDGVEDEILSRDELEKIKNDKRGCGNGVFISHDDGWQTIYCHMKKDSITVKQGQAVKKGDVIGQVGHSGYVEFPHVHLGVFVENSPIDPFTGHNDTEGCNVDPKPLWNNAVGIKYEPLAIYAAGYSAHIPDFEAIKIDTASPKVININAEALIFWAGIFGAEAGDQITIEIRDPTGKIFAQREQTQDKNRARQFYYIGKRTHNIPLIIGSYKGYIQISRKMDNNGNIIKKHEIEIPVQ